MSAGPGADADADAGAEAISVLNETGRWMLSDVLHNYSMQKTQIDAFEDAVDWFLICVRENGKRVATHYGERRELVLELTDPRLERPQFIESTGEVRHILPHECRDRRLFYEAPLTVTATLTDYRLEPILPTDPDWNATSGSTRQFRRILARHPQVLHGAIPTQIPVMVRSKYCNLSHATDLRGECEYGEGGYFIIGGFERIVVNLKNPRPSNPVIVESKNSDYALQCEIRSDHPQRARNTSTMHMYVTREHPVRVLVQVPFIKTKLSVPVMLKLLGFETAEAVRNVLWPEGRAPDGTFARRMQDILDHGLDDPLFLMSRTDMMRKIGEMSGEKPEGAVSFCHHQQSTEFLPQCGYSTDDPAQTAVVHMSKALVLRQACRRMLMTFLDPARFPLDSRDHLANRYIQLCNVSLAVMFRQLLTNYMDALRDRMYSAITRRTAFDLAWEMSRDSLAKSVRNAFTRGELTVRKAKSDTASGVIPLVPSTNWPAFHTHCSRFNKPTNKEGKYAEIREFHPSGWPFEDVPFTPEGKDVGLIGVFGVGTRIRIATPTLAIMPFVERLPEYHVLRGDVSQLLELGREATLVYVNGSVVGLTTDRLRFANEAREFRRMGYFPCDTSVSNRVDGVHIDTTNGAPVFPLVRVSEVHRIRSEALPLFGRGGGKGLLTICVELGIVEYLSPEEALEFWIVSTPREAFAAASASSANADKSAVPAAAAAKPTHVFPHPQMNMSLLTALIPFPEHDQGPRLSYEGNMVTQAMSETHTNSSMDRMDALSYWLWYKQRPIAITDAEREMDRQPLGFNPVVALGDVDAQTSEDSIIVARGAIERGMGRMFVFRTFSEPVHESGTEREVLGNPEAMSDTPCLNISLGNNYSKVGDDGLPMIGAQIQKGDVIVGKWLLTGRTLDDGRVERVRFDRSLVYNYPDRAVVDNVSMSQSGDGHRVISVRVRFMREPCVGNKLSSRHGQKGTIGAILDDWDMPFVAEGNMAGCRPDIVISPQAIGRMTIGQLMESVGGRYALGVGELLDATPFQDVSGKELLDRLRETMKEGAKVAMISGRTGEMFEARWDVAPVFYHALRHMVLDKVRARATGPNTALTRQPREGKKQDGGLKIGNMEADIFKEHGAMASLMGRMRDASDRYIIRVCRKCGMLCEPQRAPLETVATDALEFRSIFVCRGCGSKDVVPVRSRYATRLMIKELEAIGIRVGLDIERVGEDLEAVGNRADLDIERVGEDLEAVGNRADLDIERVGEDLDESGPKRMKPTRESV